MKDWKQELHRSRVFPDVDHPSKALSNVFTEKRQGGIFAGLHMPACRFSSPLPAAASTGVSRGNGRVNRDQPDITDLGNDVFQSDTRVAWPGTRESPPGT